MTYMFMMNHGMTVRTQDHKIFQCIILSVSILVMYSKDVIAFIIVTNFTSFDFSSNLQRFSYSAKRRVPYFLPNFIHTCFRTIFSFLRRRTFEFFFTMSTFIDNSTIQMLSFVIALSRAIFRFVTSRRNVFKFYCTNFAYLFYFLSDMQALTASRAKFCFIKTIKRYIEFFSAIKTIYKFSSMRFIRHATFQR